MKPETQTQSYEAHEKAPEYSRPQPYMEQPALPGFEAQFALELVPVNE